MGYPPPPMNMKHEDDGDGVGEGVENDGKKTVAFEVTAPVLVEASLEFQVQISGLESRVHQDLQV